MLASSRVPDVVVAVCCIYRGSGSKKKISHVSRSELSSLDVNETTIPLIQVLKRAYNVIPSSPIWRLLQRKLYDTYASDDGSLGLDGSGRSLRLALKTKKCMYFG